ncbi:MAG TPA: hypothetical protein V6C81_25135 [Planktothrix sp.]|jgi:hypothetical protein
MTRTSPSLQILLTAAAAVASLSTTALANTAAQPRMLVIEENTMAYGPMIVDVQKNGIRMETVDHEKTILCAAPSWDACLFNNKRKRIYKRPYAVWSQHGMQTALSMQINDFSERAVRERQILYYGLAACEYAFPRRHVKIADYITTNAIDVDPRVSKFVSSLFDCPLTDKGILMRFRRMAGRTFGFGLKYNEEKSIEICVETKKASYAPLDQKLFVAPTDYKPASDGEIFVDPAASNAAFKDLLNP